MRFARRCEGILSARVVFKMARDDQRVGYQVYVSAALMEYYCSKVPSYCLLFSSYSCLDLSKQTDIA